MRRILPLALIALWCSVVPAQETANPQSSRAEEVAERALQRVESELARGNTGWWKESGEPVLNAVGMYAGLTSDVVTFVSLNEFDNIVPAWKPVGEGLEKFGIFCSLYTCYSYARDGHNDLAVLSGLKDFIKYRLSKLSAGGAIYASGVGFLDLALNSLGNAAVSQINEDFFGAFLSYQNRRHGSLTEYAKVIGTGGLDALAKDLDTFWDEPETFGLRGYATIVALDKDYKEHFRTRFIRERLLTFLTMWAEHERNKARIDAKIALTRLLEQIDKTEIEFEIPVLESYLGEPASGYTGELQNSSKQALSTARIDGAPLKLRVPLTALANNGVFNTPVIYIKNNNDPKASPLFVSVNTRPSASWEKTVGANLIKFKARKPAFVTTSYPVTVEVGGDGAANVRMIGLVMVSPSFASAVSLGYKPGSATYVDIAGGRGTKSVPAGRYLVQWDGKLTQGPFVVKSAVTIPFDARAITGKDTFDPSAPDPKGFSSTLSAVAGKLGALSEMKETVYEKVYGAYTDYWTATVKQLSDYSRAVEAYEQKAKSTAGNPNLKPEERDKILKECNDKKQAIYKQRSRIEQEISNNISAAGKEIGDAEKRGYEERNRCEKELRESRSQISTTVYRLQSSCSKAAGLLQGIATIHARGECMSWRKSEMRTQLAAMKENLAQIEMIIPQIVQDRQSLSGLVEKHGGLLQNANKILAVTGGEPVQDFSLMTQVESATSAADDIVQSKGVERARDFVAICERKIEHREKMADKIAAMIKRVEEAAARVPAIDEPSWTAKQGEFSRRADPLFAALEKKEEEEKQGEWQSLASDMDRWCREQKDFTGDVLEGAEKSSTPFSQFTDAYMETVEFLPASELPTGWFESLNGCWQKCANCGRYVGPFVKLRREVATVAGLGKNNAERTAALDNIRAEITAKIALPDTTSTEARIAALEDVGKMLEKLPRRLVAELHVKWNQARRSLVLSGKLEELARRRGEPILIFSTVNKQAYGKGYYWPDAAPQSAPGAPIEAILTVEGVPEGALPLVMMSYDGGGHWNMIRHGIDGLRIFLPFDPNNPYPQRFRFRVEVGGKESRTDTEFFPFILFPG